MMTQYVLAEVDVHDFETMGRYLELAGAGEAKHGGAAIAGGPDSEILEGERRGSSVLLKFPDREAALAWFNDPELVETHALRNKAARSTITLLPSF